LGAARAAEVGGTVEGGARAATAAAAHGGVAAGRRSTACVGASEEEAAPGTRAASADAAATSAERRCVEAPEMAAQTGGQPRHLRLLKRPGAATQRARHSQSERQSAEHLRRETEPPSRRNQAVGATGRVSRLPLRQPRRVAAEIVPRAPTRPPHGAFPHRRCARPPPHPHRHPATPRSPRLPPHRLRPPV